MKLLAIDGNSIMNRAFYGIRILSSSKGEYTNAITGFMNIYLKEFENVSSELKIKLNITKCDINHYREIAKVFPEFLNKKFSKIE